jgi:hypothetical protein
VRKGRGKAALVDQVCFHDEKPCGTGGPQQTGSRDGNQNDGDERRKLTHPSRFFLLQNVQVLLVKSTFLVHALIDD